MSLYNSCKQFLELEQKSEDLLVAEDQAALLNETIFKNFNTIDRLKKELDQFRKYYAKKKNFLSFRNIVNVNISPTYPVFPSPTNDSSKHPWPGPKDGVANLVPPLIPGFPPPPYLMGFTLSQCCVLAHLPR